jgi:hypothetical protein
LVIPIFYFFKKTKLIIFEIKRYRITASILQQNGARTLLLENYYKCSPKTLICSIFPEYNWIPWKFRVAPQFWNKKSNRFQFLEYLKNKYQIEENEDWFRKITGRILFEEGGRSLYQKYGSISKILKSVYSNINWNEIYLSPNLYELKCSKPHLNLIKQLQNLNISEDIKINYKHPILKHSTQYPIEFDIFIPSLQIVIKIYFI